MRTAIAVLVGLGGLAILAAHSRTTMAAENLFLRKQLACFQERRIKSQRADESGRWVMAAMSWLFDWRRSLVIVHAAGLRRSGIYQRKGSSSMSGLPRTGAALLPILGERRGRAPLVYEGIGLKDGTPFNILSLAYKLL